MKIRKFIETLDAYQDIDIRGVLLKKLDPALQAKMIEEGGDIQVFMRDGNYHVVNCTAELTQTIIAALTRK